MLILVKTPDIYNLFDTSAGDIASMLRYWYSFDNKLSIYYADALEETPNVIFVTGYKVLVNSIIKTAERLTTHTFQVASQMITAFRDLPEIHFITDLHHEDNMFHVKLVPIRDMRLTPEMHTLIRTVTIDELLKTL